MSRQRGGCLLVGHPTEHHRSLPVSEQFTDDADALIDGLAGRIDRLGHALAQVTMMVDQGIAEVGKGQAAQLAHRLIWSGLARPDPFHERPQRHLVHETMLPGSSLRLRKLPPVTLSLWAMSSTDETIGTAKGPMRLGFLGPLGTFTEQAVKSQAVLAEAEPVLYRTMPDVLDAVSSGEVDLGFVAIENSIEGTVNLTQDELAFSHSLLIQGEVVLNIEHCLMAKSGTSIDDVKVVMSIPVASAQCHAYLRREVRQADLRAANSTAEAARIVAEEPGSGTAAVAPRIAAALYGLEILAADIGDHPGNQTRFVIVARDGIPAPTGHDRTAMVVYQRADEPGSLISILQEFAARRINLSNLISRPIKSGGLGEYCFVIYADGHVTDELMADTLRDLKAKQGDVKFLGSYPAAGQHAHSAREHADVRWRQADDWIRDLRHQVAE